MKKGIFLTLIFLNFNLWAANINGINFIQEGEVSKLIINHNADELKAERFHVTDDKQIILDLKNVKLPEKYSRPIDTSEFSGSIVLVKPYKKPGSKNDVRVAIQLRDNVRSILDIQKNKVTLNIENRFGVFSKAKVEKADTDSDNAKVSDLDKKIHVPKSDAIEDILENITHSGVKKYIGKKISINVKDISVTELLNYIAEVSGFNVIIDKEVGKRDKLTLSLTNIAWDEALDTILNLARLVAKKASNILMVTTFEKAQKQREAEIKSKQLSIKQEALVTKIFPISFSTLSEITTILNEYSTPERGRITSDERTNSLIVKDTVEVIEKMKKIVELLDTATPQILIEAKIVEANERYSKNIGLSSGFAYGYDDALTENPTSWTFNSAGTSAGLERVSIAIGDFSNLAFDLQLLESESKGRIVSSPKVITQNKKAATFSSTDTISFITQSTSTAGSSSNVNSVDATLSLSVTPQVTNEGSISMEVSISKSGFSTSATQDQAPDTTNRSIQTNVLVDNGSTIVIGGLYETTTSETVTGIPFLKDLPLIGWLFRSAYAPTNSRSELVIFLTPRIINQEEAGLVDRNKTLDT